MSIGDTKIFHCKRCSETSDNRCHWYREHQGEEVIITSVYQREGVGIMYGTLFESDCSVKKERGRCTAWAYPEELT